MRYTIGVTMIDKKTKEKDCGFFARYGLLALGIIVTDTHDVNNRDYNLLIFDNIEDAEKYSQILSRAYRRDDVWLNPKIKSKKIRRFYPLKVDSLNFPFELEEIKTYPFKRNRFDEETKEIQGYYKLEKIKKVKETYLSNKKQFIKEINENKEFLKLPQ